MRTADAVKIVVTKHIAEIHAPGHIPIIVVSKCNMKPVRSQHAVDKSLVKSSIQCPIAENDGFKA